MSDLAFDFEWVDPLGARGGELRATWARLAIRVGQRYASRVLDQDVKTVRDSVYLPLYPLAEWIVSNWWRLLYEIESSERAADPSYERRHSLRWAREGYSVPPLAFTSLGEILQLQWAPEFPSRQRIEFIGTGIAHLALDTVRHGLGAFVGAVTERLLSFDITETYLQREWENIVNSDPEETEFCVAAATLGLDPYDLDDVVAEAIVTVAASLPPSVRREFFSVASRDELQEQSVVVAAGIEEVRQNGADLRALLYLRDAVPLAGASDAAPWEEGYQAARMLRDDLKAGTHPIPSFDALAQVLRISNSEFQMAIIEQPGGTRAYEAIVATNRVDSPAFKLNPRSDTAMRFQVCRGLYEVIARRDEGPWLVTTGLSDRQKRNRAFAAEFLAPSAGIQEQVKSSVVSGAKVEELAQRYGVSTDAIVHQLRNHRIASVAW